METIKIQEQSSASNVGRNLQGMGTATIVVGILASIVIAIVVSNALENAIGWVIFAVGTFFSVLSGMLVRGFGRLIENSEPQNRTEMSQVLSGGSMPDSAFQ